MADKEHADKTCPLCGGRVMWFPISRHWYCEHCRNTFNEFTVFSEPKTREPNGDAAKLREVVGDLLYMAERYVKKTPATESVIFDAKTKKEIRTVNYYDVIAKAQAALAAPARNCDEGTADEQLKRFLKKLESVGCGEIDKRSIHMMSIFSRWSQLRYGSEVSDGSK